MNTMIALLKREILEHKNIWRVPAGLIGIAVLFKLSLSIGNLSVDIDAFEQFQLDEVVDSALNTVIVRALNSMNAVISLVMFLVSIFYALSCLYNERQDQSVLFWRSLPLSDHLTVGSKLVIALLAIPLVIIVSQALVSFIFLGTQAFEYLASYYPASLIKLIKLLLWSLLPVVSWCVFCSGVANRNPFLLAFVTPIMLILVDKLFFDGFISQAFVINRFTGITDYNLSSLLTGVVFSLICIALAIVKRSQRF